MRMLTALTLALFAGPAFAAEDSVPPTASGETAAPVDVAAPEPAKAEPEKKICKVVEIESGTRMRRKTCRTITKGEGARSGGSGGAIRSITGN